MILSAAGAYPPLGPPLGWRIIVSLLKTLLLVVLAPFIIAFLVVISVFLPGKATAAIFVDLARRIFDRLLWPDPVEVIVTEKRR